MSKTEDETKLLRYCLARLRAWRSEYELYSTTHEAQSTDWSGEFAGSTPNAPFLELQSEDAMPNPDYLTSLMGSIDTTSIDPVTSNYDFRLSTPHASDEAPGTPSRPTTQPPRAARGPAMQPLKLEPVKQPNRLITPTVVKRILDESPEHWQALAAGVDKRVRDTGLKVLMVASSARGEGATTISLALATAITGQTSIRVVLVDGHFAAPSLAGVISTVPSVGLEHCLLGEATLGKVIVPVDEPALSVVPMLEPGEPEAVAHVMPQFEEVLSQLREQFDLVIVDGGALAHSPIADGIDATLIVRDPAKSSPTALDRLDAQLARRGICSLGVIENGI